jgi:haloacetate dehalogenase
MSASAQASKKSRIDRRQVLQSATALVTAAACTRLAGRTAAKDEGPKAKDEGPNEEGGKPYLFPDNFKAIKVKTSGATINGVIGGKGPAVLLLHGYPLSHVSWSKVAPELAKNYTVVATDLRGYGDSSKPPGGRNHADYSKRAMAQDQVEVMKHFGFDKFAAVGHDRGGRVVHRMALDHADKVSRAAVLDIIPTSHFYQHVTQASATAYYHWFFLLQRHAETLIESNLELFVGRGQSATAKEYLRTFKIPGTIHAACEDYRAGASIDMQHDREDNGKKVECPLLVLWGRAAPLARLFDIAATWKSYARNIVAQSKGLPGGHQMPDSAPKEVTAELQAFLKS